MTSPAQPHRTSTRQDPASTWGDRARLRQAYTIRKNTTGRAAKDLFDDEALRLLEQAMQDNPEIGNVIPGTGGFRKMRVALPGRGKRGGARVVYFLRLERGRVYLLTAYAKVTTENINEAAKRQLRQIAAALKEED